MQLTTYERIVITRMLDQRIELLQSAIDDTTLYQLAYLFQEEIDELQTLKTKINETSETILR